MEVDVLVRDMYCYAILNCVLLFEKGFKFVFPVSFYVYFQKLYTLFLMKVKLFFYDRLFYSTTFAPI